MMNLGLVAPVASGEPAPTSTRCAASQTHADGGVRIGAMTTHAELAALAATRGRSGAARAGRAAWSPIRRSARAGTIGGSVALADPAADYPVALRGGRRDDRDRVGAGATRRSRRARSFAACSRPRSRAARSSTAIHVPAGPPGAGAAYEKLSLVAGDFAIVSVAAIGRPRRPTLAVGGCATKPMLLSGRRCSRRTRCSRPAARSRRQRSAERPSRVGRLSPPRRCPSSSGARCAPRPRGHRHDATASMHSRAQRQRRAARRARAGDADAARRAARRSSASPAPSAAATTASAARARAARRRSSRARA